MAHPCPDLHGVFPSSPCSHSFGSSSKLRVYLMKNYGIYPTKPLLNPIGLKPGGGHSKNKSRYIDSGSRKAYGRVLNSAPMEPNQRWSRVHLNGHSQLSTKTRRSKTSLHECRGSSTLALSQMRRRRSFLLCPTNQTPIPSSDPVCTISSRRVYRGRRFWTKKCANIVCGFV